MKGLFTIFFAVISLNIYSQSFYHNTQQFGLKSTLLGGAVTAGSEDLSMVYYNPAALRYAKGKGFDLALFMPSISRYNYGDYFNSGEDVTFSDLSLNPSLITYKTSINDFNIVFTLLQKDIWDNGIEYSNLKTDNNVDINESLKYNYSGDEKWFGFGIDHEFSKEISVGWSQFWSLQSMKYNYGINSESVRDIDQVQTSFYSDILSLKHTSLFSMITKIGFSFDRPHDRIGLVITSPNYQSLYSSASFDQSISELDNGENTLLHTSDFDITPDFRNGWQVDFGYAKILRDSSEVWLNSSFHTGVKEYELFQVQRVQNSPLIFTSGSSAIVNFSIGYARNLSSKVQFLSSVRTNFNTYRNDNTNEMTNSIVVLEKNRSQIAMGCKVNNKNSSFVIGLDWGFAVGETEDYLENYPRVDLFDRNDTSYSHNTITLLLTYEFFLDSMGRNISRMLDRTARQNEFH